MTLLALLTLPPLAALLGGCGTYAPGSSNYRKYASSYPEYSSGSSSAVAEKEFQCGENDDPYEPNVQSYPNDPELNYTVCKGIKDPTAIEIHGTIRSGSVCVFPAIWQSNAYPAPFRQMTTNAPHYRCLPITDVTRNLRTAFRDAFFKDTNGEFAVNAVYIVDAQPTSQLFLDVHTCIKLGAPEVCAGKFAVGKYR